LNSVEGGSALGLPDANLVALKAYSAANARLPRATTRRASLRPRSENALVAPSVGPEAGATASSFRVSAAIHAVKTAAKKSQTMGKRM
jgi:hypothetical protein